MGPPRLVKAHGTWEFDPKYVNGSAPDDFAAMQLKLAPGQRIRNTTWATWDGLDKLTDVGYLKDSGVTTGAPIVGLRDGMTKDGFSLNVRKGVVDTVVEGGSGQVGAAFAYEHNQDGGAVMSVSAAWGAFGVTYTGNESHMRKSMQPVYTNL